jgi:hypothetical protein
MNHVKVLPEFCRKTHADTTQEDSILPTPVDTPEPNAAGPRTKNRGQNKGRKFPSLKDSVSLCRSILSTGACPDIETCKNSHDIKAYMAEKGPDIDSSCYIFDTFGFCKFGLGCRFAGAHIDENYNNIKKEGIHNVSSFVKLLVADQKDVRFKFTANA